MGSKTQIVCLRRLDGYRDVGDAFAYHYHRTLVLNVVQRNGDTGVLTLEFRNHVRHRCTDNRRKRSDRYASVVPACGLLEACNGMREIAHRFTCNGRGMATGIGKFQRTRCSREQSCSHLAFDAPDRFAKRGLRNSEPLRCCAETRGIRRLCKNLKLT